MKILSRADRVRKGHTEFLLSNGLAYEGESNVLNPLPYTVRALINGRGHLCYGLSICSKVTDTEEGRVREEHLQPLARLLQGSRDTPLSTRELFTAPLNVGNALLIFGLEFNVREIMILRDAPLEVTRVIPPHEKVERSVRALTVVFEGGRAITALFHTPVVIESVGTRTVALYSPSTNVIEVSSTSPIEALRRYLVSAYSFRANIVSRYYPILETLDGFTIAVPTEFSGTAVELNLINPMDRALNAVLKAYRSLIRKVVFEGVTEYSYRHSVIRVAMPPHSEASLKLVLQFA